MNMFLVRRTALACAMYSVLCTGWTSTSIISTDHTNTKCFQETFIASELKVSEVSFQQINWKEMRNHLLKVLLMFKRIEFKWLKDDLI